MNISSDPRRVVWPYGAPTEAVIVDSLPARWWAQFRLGWSFDPRKLRQVCTAKLWYGDDGSNPEASARQWEMIISRTRVRQGAKP